MEGAGAPWVAGPPTCDLVIPMRGVCRLISGSKVAANLLNCSTKSREADGYLEKEETVVRVKECMRAWTCQKIRSHQHKCT